MKKLMLLVAMLALVLVAAAPAIAQVSQGFKESGIRSGVATPKVAISNTGNNANLCPTAQQVANTGNVANEQGVTQYNDLTGDISFDGSSLTIDPSATATCDQSINQAASA